MIIERDHTGEIHLADSFDNINRILGFLAVSVAVISDDSIRDMFSPGDIDGFYLVFKETNEAVSSLHKEILDNYQPKQKHFIANIEPCEG